MLKLCLQLLVCLTLALRVALLVGHLRRAWRGATTAPLPPEGRALAGEFHAELRRRGLLPGRPLAQPD